MSLISDVCEKQPLLDFLNPPDEKDTAIILKRVLSDLHAGQLSFVNDTKTEILGSLHQSLRVQSYSVVPSSICQSAFI